VIDIDPEAIVARPVASDGRFVIFSSDGVAPGWPLRFWGVVADTGADGHGLLVRLDAMVACDGWTVLQLLGVVRARLAAERERAGAGAGAREAEAAVICLNRALAAYADLPAAAAPPFSGWRTWARLTVRTSRSLS
jgi:hypothetical protein